MGSIAIGVVGELVRRSAATTTKGADKEGGFRSCGETASNEHQADGMETIISGRDWAWEGREGTVVDILKEADRVRWRKFAWGAKYFSGSSSARPFPALRCLRKNNL